jgi:hypothetical protein
MPDSCQSSPIFSRNRVLLFVWILAVVILGLASRRYPILFPELLGKYPGDALWSLMVYLGWALLKPSAPPYRIAIFTLMTSYLVEGSQLIQAPWLNMIRHTTLGYLVLGTVFSWYDIFSYTVGIILGFYLDRLLIRRISLRK